MKHKLRVLSLCTGIGGFDLAAEWAGFEIAGQVEIDPYCIALLEQHWPTAKRMRDVYEVRGDEFGPIDLICAGFPCQPYSQAGKRKGASDDRAIWPEIFRITQSVRPTWACFENVPGIIGMELDRVLSDLEGEDYTCWPLVIPACAVDAKHRRDRVWIVGHAASRGQEGFVRGTGDTERERAIGKTEWRRCEREFIDAGQDVADAKSERPREAGRLRTRQAERIAGSGETVSDTQSIGSQQAAERCEQGQSLSELGSDRRCKRLLESPLGQLADGLPSGLVRQGEFCQWAEEPPVPRVAKGVRDRVHRLKGLGNSVVPQVVYEIVRGVAEIEGANRQSEGADA